MSRSEIAEANAIVASVTHLLDRVQEAEEDEVLLRLYADDDAFRLAHPDAGDLDNALHGRIIRTAARAAWRMGYDVTLLRLRGGPMQAWLARQAPSGAGPEAYPGEPGDTLSGEAAMRALGVGPAELRQAPRKPSQGRTLAARIARWATDPEADEGLIGDLTEELLAQRLDGALGVVATMLEPEDDAYARHEIDLAASSCVIGEKGRQREALLFVSPVLRDGATPCPASIPAGLQARLTGIALDPSFVELILAPFWIPTASLARLKPSDLRDAAEALVNGIEPSLDRAAPGDRDVCLLGLTIPMLSPAAGAEVEDGAAEDRLDAWLAVVADAAGGGRAEPPLALARALDLLRRVRLAVPDDPGMEDEPDDEEDVEVDEALLDALLAHLRDIGDGDVLLTGFPDGVVAFRLTNGAPDIELDALRGLLAEALAEGGLLFLVPAGRDGAPIRGHAYLLDRGEAEGLSAADAAASFAEEAPEEWAARPAAWLDAPALDYDPAID